MNIQRGIEYYYGGPEAETVKMSFKKMKQYAAQLRAGEQVLYLNTLTSAREVEAVADAVSKRHRSKVSTFTMTADTLARRLPFLSLNAAAKNVRVIVLNCIDFAARTTNQKKALVHWLREMRDVHSCRVIVFGIHAPTEDGAVGQLKFVTEKSLRYDQWTKETVASGAVLFDDDAPMALPHPSTAAEAILSELEQDLPVLEEESIEEEFVDEEGVVSRSLHNDFSALASLRINDLTGARALRAMKNEELRMKNEGRQLALA